MRRLLIRLVAVETMLTGWLAYWLFLVYANNPLVSEGLADQLGKFPQISFTAVDISVLVVIASLSILMAVKFQRGLRPGIRLERALQMLESLMKRNLVLEAQAAEMKLEKAHASPSILSSPSLPSLSAEAKPGSWDRVFKTPIEAGPTATTVQSRSSSISDESSGHTTSLAHSAPRVETRQSPHPRPSFLPKDERPSEKTALAAANRVGTPLGASPSGPVHSAWEDFSKLSSDIAVPKPPVTYRESTNAVSVSLAKQPYIPVPVPKSATPPIVITGPGVLPAKQQVSSQTKPPSKSTVEIQPPSTSIPALAGRARQPAVEKPSGPLMPLGVPGPRPSPTLGATAPVSKPEGALVKEAAKGVAGTKAKFESKTEAKAETKGETKGEAGAEVTREIRKDTKPAAKPLKKFAYEED